MLQRVFEFVHDRSPWATVPGTSHTRPRLRFLFRVSRKACPTPDGPPALDSQRSKRAGITLLPFVDAFPSFPYPPAWPAGRAPVLPPCASRVSSRHPFSRCSSVLFRLAVRNEVRAGDNSRLTKTGFPSP